MDKRFQLQSRAVIADLRDLLQGELAGEHDALRARFLPEARRIRVCGVCLRGNVQRQVGRYLSCQSKDARIRHQSGIRADLLQKTEGLFQLGKIGIFCKDIDGDVHLFSARMDVLRGGL